MVEQRQFVPLQALHVLQDKAEMLDGRQTQLFLERSHDILGEEETIQLPKDSANFIFYSKILSIASLFFCHSGV